MKKLYDLHVSIDCVLIGFDGEQMNVLLVERKKLEDHPQSDVVMKLPGRLIFSTEAPEDAAADMVDSITGLKNASLTQFKVFGEPDRTSHSQDDIDWLKKLVYSEAGYELDVKRILTIGYMAPLRISTKLKNFSTEYNATWCSIEDLPRLAFDHQNIVKEAMAYLRTSISHSPEILFSFLPAKFTILSLRKLYELITGKPQDVRNFHKKVQMMTYVKPLDIWQKRVAHRAARYYTFDKKVYNRLYRQA